MARAFLHAFSAVLILLLAGCAAAPQPASAPERELPANELPAKGTEAASPDGAATGDGEGTALLDALRERQLEDDVFLRLQEGLPVTKLPELSRAATERDVRQAEELLARARKIDAGALSHEDRVSLELARFLLEVEVEEIEACYWHLSYVTPYSSPLPILHRVFTEAPLGTAEERERYLALLDQYPERIAEIRAHLEGAMERGIVLPRPAIALVVPIIGSFRAEPVSSLFLPAPERLTGMDSETGEAFRAEAARRIEEEINPALLSLAAFLSGPYEARAPEAVGLYQYPGGRECYRHRVRSMTTLDVDPEEVHLIGLAEVERLSRQMAELRDEISPGASREEFHRALRTEPRFRAKAAEAIGERLRSYLPPMEERLDELFLRLPEADYDVARLDPSLEGGMTFGFYRPPTEDDPRGLYYYNGSTPEERPLFWAQALLYHELIPGHHFQIALQQENEDLHPWRRNVYLSAYGEGWAEYASSLGEEMGLYSDPYDLYGRWAHEMFLALRLVVDTGMNHLGWSRDQAMELMREHSLETETQILTETLRYAVDMPGQALAYKMGALEIHRLRDRAEEALGDDFRLPAFHAAVLEPGNLPMDVLALQVEHFIEEGGVGYPSSP